MKERSNSRNLGSPERKSRSKRDGSTSSVEDRKRKKRKRDFSSSSSSSSSASSSSTSTSSESDKDEKKKKRSKKEKKNKKKEKRRMKKEKKRLKKLLKREKKKLKKAKEQENNRDIGEIPDVVGPDPLVNKDLEAHLLEASKARAPMTKEEWEKQQSVMRRVYDADTGRHRLVKGTGEILEECVSRERHLAINKAATKGDGEHFQSTIMSKIKDL